MSADNDTVSKYHTKRTCPGCGVDFVKPRCIKQSYCTHACLRDAQRKAARIQRTCKGCGTTFSVRQGQVNKGQGIYCTPECYKTTVSPRLERVCHHCGITFKKQKYRIEAGEGKYCSHACYIQDRSVCDERFWDNVTKRDNGCWEWMGKPMPVYGYGRLRVNGRQTRAHRHAYVLKNGAIPNGKMVLHHCDNRICVNPDHLFLGTGDDNMKDMVAKGRSLKGEKHPLAKVTNKQALEIIKNFERYSFHKSNASELAKKHKVPRRYITQLVYRLKHGLAAGYFTERNNNAARL